MKKTKVVLFKREGGVKIYTNPPSLSELQKFGDILVNPNIPKGIPLEQWRLINGKIRGPVTIEKAFPENKLIEPTVIRWFKPFAFVSIIGLFSLEAIQYKEEINSFLDKIASFF